VGGYGQDLDANLQDLHARVHCGVTGEAVAEVFIPKADGRLRARCRALEDKIFSGGRRVLNAFTKRTFSFLLRFCPGVHRTMRWMRSRSDPRERVNWVLDTDFRDYFQP